MNILIVSAHPNPTSYNAQLVEVATRTLQQGGDSVVVSDLYAEGFKPAEGPEHFDVRVDPERFEVQREQRAAFEAGTLPADVRRELDRLREADLVIFQFPFWWFGVPAMIKGWMDRVFVYGGMYTSEKLYAKGVCRGKRAILSATLGSPESHCHSNGQQGDPRLHLWSAMYALHAVGFKVLDPILLHGIHGAYDPSAAQELREHLSAQEHTYVESLQTLSTRPSVQFNVHSSEGIVRDQRRAKTA